ncbi:MAG: alpha/beta hydrolase-fold protein [Actinomycetota bacterium]|nr:alpha/beta hydrolase-fold protein [Actinomycetota bacterium]
MTLREAQGSPGPPWERPLRGHLTKVVIESELLADNPLGDPARRPLAVYQPPDLPEGQRLPTIYVIQGLTGQLDMWFNREAFEATMLERVDALFGSGDCPPALVVFVDAWTSYGGSQFINSVSTGPYMDYLCDEVVPFVDERWSTLAAREHRGLTGKSSGGYGAMVVPMLRPDVFGALASHAGDALFETCYLPDFRDSARTLRDHFDGSFDTFWDAARSAEKFDWEVHGGPMNTYAMAACYSPDENNPGKALLPFEVSTGRLIDEVWDKWLEWDPVRMAPHHGDALSSMKRIYLDAGKSDQFYLDLGAQAFASELDKLGVEYTLDLFEGTHMGLQYRYPGALRELAVALSEPG